MGKKFFQSGEEFFFIKNKLKWITFIDKIITIWKTSHQFIIKQSIISIKITYIYHLIKSYHMPVKIDILVAGKFKP